jgi:predicted enzyme related to lactoylglutathione lyase
MTNAVMHWQMLSANPDKAADFYGGLFDWQVSASNGLGYREVTTGGPVDGGIWPAPPGAPEAVQIYVEVADIDTALARAVELGGSVIMPKQVLPDGDAMALVLDPLGRSFGVMTRRPAAEAEMSEVSE